MEVLVVCAVVAGSSVNEDDGGRPVFASSLLQHAVNGTIHAHIVLVLVFNGERIMRQAKYLISRVRIGEICVGWVANKRTKDAIVRVWTREILVRGM